VSLSQRSNSNLCSLPVLAPRIITCILW